MHTMHKVFISGPYRATTEWALDSNIRAARQEAAIWWNLGAAVFCPHSNSSHMGGVVPDENFLRADLEFLSSCQTLVALRGWRNSSGSAVEVRTARQLGLRILYCTPTPGLWHTATGAPFSIDEARTLCGVSTSPMMEDTTTPPPSASESSSSCPPEQSTSSESPRCTESSARSCVHPLPMTASWSPAQLSWSPSLVLSSPPDTES